MYLAALLLLINSAVHADTVSKLWGRGYSVLPEPQQVELASGDVRFGPRWSLELGPGVPAGDVAVETLKEEMQARFGLGPAASGPGPETVRLVMRAGSVAPGKATSSGQKAIADQAYRVEMKDGEVTIAANAPEGLFYGVTTFIQLLRPRDGALWLPRERSSTGRTSSCGTFIGTMRTTWTACRN